MLYNGVEVMSTKQLTLFDKDPIDWQEHEDITPFLQTLIKIKKQPIFKDGNVKLHFKEGGAVISYTLGHKKCVGFVNVEGVTLSNIPLDDGEYVNILNGETVMISHQTYQGQEPVWIEV